MSLFRLFGPPNVEKLEAKRDIQGLIKALGYQKRGDVRKAATEALGKIGTPAVEPLIAALRNRNVHEAAVEPLIAILRDQARDVRQAAIEALGKTGGARAVAPLIALLKDSDWQVRQAAVRALGELKDSRAVEPLIAALQDTYLPMRQAAVEALGELKDDRTVEPLIAALQDSDSNVRHGAARALGKIRNVRAMQAVTEWEEQAKAKREQAARERAEQAARERTEQAARERTEQAARDMRESSDYKRQPSGKAGELPKKDEIKKVLERARERHQLPELEEILAMLVAVEQMTNYATVVRIALQTVAEYRGVYIGDLKSAYMKCWWQWHNSRNNPKHRAERILSIAAEAARVHPASEIGWMLISCLLVWIDEGAPDRANILKEHFGDIPTLDEIQKYQAANR